MEGILIFNDPEDFLQFMEDLQEKYLAAKEEGVDYNIWRLYFRKCSFSC
ncbi:MAG: hypothetical protein IKG36_02725 [Mycoplasmataceae bacterium]|nr:hypothetical protein [Mycoplasmataceae bacterium]